MGSSLGLNVGDTEGFPLDDTEGSDVGLDDGCVLGKVLLPSVGDVDPVIVGE